MTLDGLKAFIRNINENDVFDFAAAVYEPILDCYENWQQDWTVLFKAILTKIKSGKGYKDLTNENGKYMLLPFPKNSKKNMVVFFKPSHLSPVGRYLIYHFKIDN